MGAKSRGHALGHLTSLEYLGSFCQTNTVFSLLYIFIHQKLDKLHDSALFEITHFFSNYISKICLTSTKHNNGIKIKRFITKNA